MRFDSDQDYLDWLNLHNEPSFSEVVPLCGHCRGPLGEGGVTVNQKAMCANCSEVWLEDAIDLAMRGKRSYPETAA